MAFDTEALLLDYQKAAVADEAEVIVIEKSRRVGISWGYASKAALVAAAAKKAGGMNVFYIGYNQDMARDFINDAAQWAKAYDLVAGEISQSIFRDSGGGGDKDILVFEIHFHSGFRVQALSSRPSNLRGKQGLIIIDEAAFHERLGELIKAAMAMLIWGGKVIIISTHNGDTNPFAELVAEIRAGRKNHSLHRITFRDALDAGLYKRICQVKGTPWTPDAERLWVAKMYSDYGDDAAEELDVIPSGGEGHWLARALIERAMRPGIPVLRWKQTADFTMASEQTRHDTAAEWLAEHVDPHLDRLPRHLLHYFGEDFGRTGDLTVIWILQRRPDYTLHTPLVIELRNIPFDQQRQILFHILDRLPRLAGGRMDARGNGQYLAEKAMQKYGSTRAEPVMLTTQWYRDNMPPVKAAVEDNALTLPKDADIMGDLRSVRVEKGVARIPDTLRLKGSDGGQRHGDAAIALAMAHSAAKGEAAVYEYESVEGAQEWVTEFGL